MLILDGSVTMTIGGESREMREGDVCVVNRGVEHELHSSGGVVHRGARATSAARSHPGSRARPRARRPRRGRSTSSGERGHLRPRPRRLARGLVLGAGVPGWRRTATRRSRSTCPRRTHEAGLTQYAELTAAAMGDADDVVVVGHSSAPPRSPLVASLQPVRHLVFLCGLVPSRAGASPTGTARTSSSRASSATRARRGRRLVLAGPRPREALRLPRLLGRRRRMGGEPASRAQSAARHGSSRGRGRHTRRRAHVRPLPRRAVHPTRLMRVAFRASCWAWSRSSSAAAIRRSSRDPRSSPSAARPTRLSRPDFACSPTGLP